MKKNNNFIFINLIVSLFFIFESSFLYFCFKFIILVFVVDNVEIKPLINPY